MKKVETYISENNFNSIEFLKNESFIMDECILVGTRGWLCPEDDFFDEKDRKIYNREINRFENAIEKIINISEDKEIIAIFHFPPFNLNCLNTEFLKVIRKYDINKIIFGHIHGEECEKFNQIVIKDMSAKLVSADNLKFRPSVVF